MHQSSMIEVIIPEDYFIMFHCGLVHCGALSWFISRGEYSSNTNALFTIAENDFNLTNEELFKWIISFVLLSVL